MAFDDVTALGAIRALTKAGVKVPDQCSVIGFDDVAPAALSSPPLTTVRQPMETMGATAVGIVVEAVNAEYEQREVAAIHKKLAPELIVRQSTRARS
jgi:LacI family transcriptional regulator